MEKSAEAKRLKDSADKTSVVDVLALFGSNIRVRLPMTVTLWNSDITELNLSVRSSNGLMRSGARTVGDVSELIMGEKGLSGVRNLGRKSVSEIKTSMLVFAYEKLNDSEKAEFWLYVVNENGGRYDA